MRPRIRSIKPETALDETLWDLGQKTGMPVYQAFTMLWCYADREGRFEWRPRALKALILPYWEGDLGSLLSALADHGFLVRYDVDSKPYGLVKNFHKHQSPNTREPASAIPGPDDARTCVHVQTHAQPDEGTAQDEQVLESTEKTEGDVASTAPHVHARAPRASSSSSLISSSSSSHEGGAGGGGAPDETPAKPMPLDWQPNPVTVDAFRAKHSVSAKALEIATQEFVGYWTIGDGAGRRKRSWNFAWQQWMLRRLKDADLEPIERQPRRGERPPGEAQHYEHKLRARETDRVAAVIEEARRLERAVVK